MKCEHCGYDDRGTGDTAHVCTKWQHTMDLLYRTPPIIGKGDHLPDHAAMAKMINEQERRIAELEAQLAAVASVSAQAESI